MEVNNAINAVIIDTNAFDGKGNDFCGRFSSVLPAFFASLQRLHIQLLSHPVLKGETIRHINAGDLRQRPDNAIKALKRNKPIYEMVGLSTEEYAEKIRNLNLCKDNIQRFEEYYANAVLLPYASPELVFRKYFNQEAPFTADNSKKTEFPDAFVIGGIESYLADNPNAHILVISNDGDWQSALKGRANITFEENIDAALQSIYKYDETIATYIHSVENDIAKYITSKIEEDVWFELPGYECEDDIDVLDARLVDINESVVPFQFSNDVLVVQVTINIEVDGTAVILDYDNSVWDDETESYILSSYLEMEFIDASGEVKAELKIKKEESMHVLEYVKIVAPRGVSLDVDEVNASFSELYFDVDFDDENAALSGAL